MYRAFFIFCILTIALVHADWTLEASKRPRSRIDTLPKNNVADFRTLPQDPAYYATQVEAMDAEKQAAYDAAFNEKYFKPWHLTRLDIPQEDFGWELRFIRKKPIYYENGRKIPPSVYERWIANANYKALDTKKYKAITVHHTDLKALPTESPFYRDPRKVGEGFPFDYNQNSALHINVPLYISHFSRDNRWAFVRASYSFGWVRVRDLALVSDRFVKRFENGHYAIAVRDNLLLRDEAHKPVSYVKLGALFPKASDGKRYLVARRDERVQAHIAYLTPKSDDLLAEKPLPFTPKNVAKIAKAFYGEPYGWGGSYLCRDCSATTRDFFAPFGIFLRRNSSKQANDGESIEMRNWPKEYKKEFIARYAKPFRSLLYVPGHIVLYLGTYKGEPVIMHTYWGIRKKDGSKLITARTIISSTEPGKERSDVKERSKLIYTLRRIVNF